MPLRYNWRRGSPSKGKQLFDLACDILTESSIKSADSRRLKMSVPQITFTYEGVEDLLGLIDRVEKINMENTYETIIDLTRQRKTSRKTPHPRVMEVHDSPERSDNRLARDNTSSIIGCQDLEGDSPRWDHSSAQRKQHIANNGSGEGRKLDHKQDTHADAYSKLEKALSLIAEQKYFEAVGSLMVVKDSVSAFQDATNERYKIYLTASTYIGIIYWLNGNMDLSLHTLLQTLNLCGELGRKGDQDSLL